MDITVEGRPVKPPKHEQTDLKRHVSLVVWAAAALAVVAVVMGALYFTQLKQQPLLSPAITTAVHGFNAYFYKGSIPAGYQFDPGRIGLQNNILFLPLTSPGKPGVTITEQALGDAFDFDSLQTYATKVDGAVAPAVINDVEGRLVGIMPVPATKTLILLNATPGMNKDELTDLIKGLQKQ